MPPIVVESSRESGALRLALHAMATRFELVLEGAREVGEEALALIEECDARYSLFRSDSLLARINRDAAREPVRVDAETFELLAACQDLSRATDGAFDVCVEPWMRAAGFREIASAGERGGFELDERERTVRFTTAGTALDLGGIVKGHALDLAAARLRELGVERALLHGGTSSVIALGANGAPPETPCWRTGGVSGGAPFAPSHFDCAASAARRASGARRGFAGESAWRVQIGSGEDAPVVELRDCALSVSAPHGRVVAGRGHVVDPRDGSSVELGGLAAALDASARTAEAWSKAALVLAARGSEIPRPHPTLALRLRGEFRWLRAPAARNEADLLPHR